MESTNATSMDGSTSIALTRGIVSTWYINVTTSSVRETFSFFRPSKKNVPESDLHRFVALTTVAFVSTELPVSGALVVEVFVLGASVSVSNTTTGERDGESVGDEE